MYYPPPFSCFFVVGGVFVVIVFLFCWPLVFQIISFVTTAVIFVLSSFVPLFRMVHGFLCGDNKVFPAMVHDNLCWAILRCQKIEYSTVKFMGSMLLTLDHVENVHFIWKYFTDWRVLRSPIKLSCLKSDQMLVFGEKRKHVSSCAESYPRNFLLEGKQVLSLCALTVPVTKQLVVVKNVRG